MAKRVDWTIEQRHISRIFPKRLAEMMNGMTFAQLSILSGVSPGTLTNWSNGRTVPDLVRLFAVCNVLDASIDWIVGLDEIANAELQEDKSALESVVSDTQKNVYYIHPLEDEIE